MIGFLWRRSQNGFQNLSDNKQDWTFVAYSRKQTFISKVWLQDLHPNLTEPRDLLLGILA
jgi:hypothetical protein